MRLADGEHGAREAGGDEEPCERERAEQQLVHAANIVHACALLEHAASAGTERKSDKHRDRDGSRVQEKTRNDGARERERGRE